jgi:hypothetical protein
MHRIYESSLLKSTKIEKCMDVQSILSKYRWIGEPFRKRGEWLAATTTPQPAKNLAHTSLDLEYRVFLT